MLSDNSQPVVVTFREVNKIFSGREALPNLQEAANQDKEVSPMQRAAIMAAMGNVLRQLQRAESEAGALVLTTVHDGPGSRLQSLIASGEAARSTFAPLTSGGLEAQFDTQDWSGWATVAWAKLRHPRPHPMLLPGSSRAETIPNEVRIGVLGDWGTGLYGAPRIARAIRDDPDPFFALFHLGDVYYSGSATEIQKRFLDLWPLSRATLHRALNSNHEMYSGGEPYFSKILPYFGQEASYFALQNKHWTLVGLDVAYRDHQIDDPQVQWLRDVLSQAGERKVIFFSHHQLYSHFEIQGEKLWNHPGFGEILRSKRVFAWYWGHEHRCAVFEDRDEKFGLYARCIGHGGMPQTRDRTRSLPRAGEPVFARAEWRRSEACVMAGNPLPSCVVLDGRNPFIPDEEGKFAPHGYAVLTLDGPSLKEQILDPAGVVIYEKILTGS